MENSIEFFLNTHLKWSLNRQRLSDNKVVHYHLEGGRGVR